MYYGTLIFSRTYQAHHYFYLLTRKQGLAEEFGIFNFLWCFGSFFDQDNQAKSVFSIHL